MKNKISYVILTVVLLVGLGLLLYPTISNFWNNLHQTRAIASYTEAVKELDDEESERVLKAAEEYNAALTKRGNRWTLSEQEQEEYEQQLNVAQNGMMGYIEIPSLQVSLPIYHGVSNAVLQVATGHIETSSLPVGGTGTHTLISGHRGLPSARLFTDLDRLVEGDLFMICVLNRVVTYEVDQIRIVEPVNVSNLGIEADKDQCTLITCTPYGVNSHRLLVRGHRVENVEVSAQIKVTADAVQVEPLVIAPIIGVPILLLLFIALLIGTKRGNS